jgi:hypothetical protein
MQDFNFSFEDAGETGSIESFLADDALLEGLGTTEDTSKGIPDDILDITDKDKVGDSLSELGFESEEQEGNEGGDEGGDEGSIIPPTPPTPPTLSPQNDTYVSVLRDIYEVDVIDIDGTLVPVEDAELTPEIFASVILDINQKKEAAIKANSVETNTLSDVGKRLVEIDRAGGNITKAIELYDELINPLEAMDMDSVADQERAIAIYSQLKGREEDETKRLLRSYKEEGILQEKALGASDALKDAYNKYLDNQKELANTAKEAKTTGRQRYATELTESLGKLEIADKVRASLVKEATKDLGKDRIGIDGLYEQVRNKPDEAAELILFLTDKDAYIKSKFSTLDRETKLSLFRTAGIARRQSSGGGNTPAVPKRGEKGEIPLDILG